MKQLREGYTTGSCAAAASFASVLWQTSGKCPEWVELEVPAGKLLHLEIQAEEAYTCGVQKDGGDDPDETNGCLVTASVEILPAAGAVQFRAGTGVGMPSSPKYPPPDQTSAFLISQLSDQILFLSSQVILSLLQLFFSDFLLYNLLQENGI